MDHASIEGDEIVIRIKVEDLKGAAYQGLEEVGVDVDEDEVDYASLARDVVTELNSEEEDGTTPVNRMLDAAVFSAAENGADAFSYLGD